MEVQPTSDHRAQYTIAIGNTLMFGHLPWVLDVIRRLPVGGNLRVTRTAERQQVLVQHYLDGYVFTAEQPEPGWVDALRLLVHQPEGEDT